MPIEQWRPIAAYPGYEVSDHGNVRRGDRIRSLTPDSNGRLRVSFWVNGKAKKVAVHILVAEAFLGPRPEGLVVRHKNGDHTFNYLSNLSYGTPIENEADKIEHGTQVNGTRHHSAKLDEASVTAIRQRHALGGRANGFRAIGRDFGVNYVTVVRIVRRQIWKHIP